MAKAKSAVKKSAAKEAFGSQAMPSKVVLFPKPVASKKPAKRAASSIKRTRAAQELKVKLDEARLIDVVEEAPVIVPVPAAAVKAVKPAAVAKAAEHKVKSSPAGKGPHKGLVNAVCFWAGTVLSDSNAFLRMKKAN